MIIWPAAIHPRTTTTIIIIIGTTLDLYSPLYALSSSLYVCTLLGHIISLGVPRSSKRNGNSTRLRDISLPRDAGARIYIYILCVAHSFLINPHALGGNVSPILIYMPQVYKEIVAVPLQQKNVNISV